MKLKIEGMIMDELIKRLAQDRATLDELQTFIIDERHYLRAHALMALGRWLTAHPDYEGDNALVKVLVSAITDTSPYARISVPLHYANVRLLALGCLHDLRIQAARDAYQSITSAETLPGDDMRLLAQFLNDREAIEFFTGTKSRGNIRKEVD